MMRGAGAAARARRARGRPGLAVLAVGSAPPKCGLGSSKAIFLGEVCYDAAGYALVGDLAVTQSSRGREHECEKNETLVDGRHRYSAMKGVVFQRNVLCKE